MPDEPVASFVVVADADSNWLHSNGAEREPSVWLLCGSQVYSSDETVCCWTDIKRAGKPNPARLLRAALSSKLKAHSSKRDHQKGRQISDPIGEREILVGCQVRHCVCFWRARTTLPTEKL